MCHGQLRRMPSVSTHQSVDEGSQCWETARIVWDHVSFGAVWGYEGGHTVNHLKYTSSHWNRRGCNNIHKLEYDSRSCLRLILLACAGARSQRLKIFCLFYVDCTSCAKYHGKVQWNALLTGN